MRKILSTSFFILLVFLLILMLSCLKTDLPEDSNDKSEKTITGRVIATITEPSSSEIPNKGVCDNAQNYNLCNDLDSKVEEGYRQACCDKFNICC